MSDFWEWAFSYHAPNWVVPAIGILFAAAFIGWVAVVASLAEAGQDFASILVLVMPIFLIALALWKAYRADREATE